MTSTAFQLHWGPIVSGCYQRLPTISAQLRWIIKTFPLKEAHLICSKVNNAPSSPAYSTRLPITSLLRWPTSVTQPKTTVCTLIGVTRELGSSPDTPFDLNKFLKVVGGPFLRAFLTGLLGPQCGSFGHPFIRAGNLRRRLIIIGVPSKGVAHTSGRYDSPSP
ncbi:hypothetical protein BC826DRAFT_1037600 [Russula brevipes]|nr:hypothetical protein BC826DRAFT_1037600 [Russula brevipes]